MKVCFLGTGGGLCSPSINFHSNMLLINKHEHYLGYDCGVTWQMAMEAAGYDVMKVDHLFISHLHDDHAGCLGTLAFKRYFGSFPFGKNRPLLHVNAEIADEMWDKYLAAALESIQDQRNTLDTYFEVDRIKPNGSFTWSDVQFNLVQTVHVVDDRRIKPSYGLIFDTDDQTIFMPGDTQFAPNQMLTFYERSDWIFQDCELAEYNNSIHAQYHQLLALEDHIREKMWLYHNDGEQPDAVEAGFAGFIKKGQTFDFAEMRTA